MDDHSRDREALGWLLLLIAALAVLWLTAACATYQAITAAPPGAIDWLGRVGAALLDDLVSLVAWIL